MGSCENLKAEEKERYEYDKHNWRRWGRKR